MFYFAGAFHIDPIFLFQHDGELEVVVPELIPTVVRQKNFWPKKRPVGHAPVYK